MKPFLVLTFLLTGCATIMHGTNQDIGISSNPTGAEVTVDGTLRGATPLVTEMKRGNNHIVKLQLPGYAPYEATFTKSVSGWVVGNLLFGGLIGLAVDAITGGLYNLSPEQLAAQLGPGTRVSLEDDDVIRVFVVMQPRPEWQLVAQLSPHP